MIEQPYTRKIRILVADDHRVVREQLAARLSRENDLEVVALASTSRDVWQEARAKVPDVVVIDPLMRDGLGLATVRQLRSDFPTLVILILTSYVDTALNMQFQQMGIQHILTKGIASPRLLAELRAACSTAGFTGNTKFQPDETRWFSLISHGGRAVRIDGYRENQKKPLN